MPTSLQLKEQRERVFKDMKDIRATLGDDGKFTDPTQETRYRAADADFQRLSSAIRDAEAFEAIERQNVEAEYEARQRNPVNTDVAGSSADPQVNYDPTFWRYLQRTYQGLNEDERRILEARGTSTQITTTDSLGGYLVPTAFSNQLEMKMKYYGGALEAVDTFDDPIGGTLEWPTGDDTGNTGEEQSSEGADINTQDMTFGQVLFGDITISSGIVKVSRQLMQDERVGLLQGTLNDALAERLGRRLNTRLTLGNGSSGQPIGLVPHASLGNTASSATAFTKAELIIHKYTVDRAYRVGPKVGWMLNDAILSYAIRLDVGNTDTVQMFTPGNYLTNEPDKILGQQIFVNNDMTDTQAAAAKIILYGDFSKYKLRRIRGVSIERNDSLYWAGLKIGFMGWMRYGANLVGEGAIKYFRNA